MQDQTSIPKSERVLIFQIKLQGYGSILECACRCYLSSTEHIGDCLFPKTLYDSVTRHPCDRTPQESNLIVCPNTAVLTQSTSHSDFQLNSQSKRLNS